MLSRCFALSGYWRESGVIGTFFSKNLIMNTMKVIINPGSENTGGTIEQATVNAQEWLKSIHDEGFCEVQMKFKERYGTGNFLFVFTHRITQKEAFLEIHGFTEEECKEFIFHPRVYWNGSSTSNPKIEDWLADGFKYRIEYYSE